MTVVVKGADTRSLRVAQLVSDVLDPVVSVIAATLVVAIHSAGWGRGVELSVVSQREQRPALMGIALVSVLVALLAMCLMDAPGALFALVAAMVVGLATCLAISLVWKVSIHTACAAGAVAALAVLVHPGLLFLSILVVLIGWSRVVRAPDMERYSMRGQGRFLTS